MDGKWKINSNKSGLLSSITEIILSGKVPKFIINSIKHRVNSLDILLFITDLKNRSITQKRFQKKIVNPTDINVFIDNGEDNVIRCGIKFYSRYNIDFKNYVIKISTFIPSKNLNLIMIKRFNGNEMTEEISLYKNKDSLIKKIIRKFDKIKN